MTKAPTPQTPKGKAPSKADAKAQHPIFRKASSTPTKAGTTAPRSARGTETPKQVRGDDLKAAIRSTIEALASEAHANGKVYSYVGSHVAKAVPCARKSLDNHADFIQDILNTIGSNRRARDGGVMIEALRARIAQLEKRNQDLAQENQALAAEHIAIYDTLTLQSVPASALLPGRTPQAGTVVPFNKPQR